MQVDFINLPKIFLQASICFAIYFFFYKKYIYSIFDPIFIYVFTLAFSSVLILNTLAETQPIYAFHFFICQFFFFIGFALTTYKFGRYKEDWFLIKSPLQFPDYSTTRSVIYLLFIICFIANISLLLSTGFALLSDSPTVARAENATAGWAVVSVINFSVKNFVLAGLFFLIISDYNYTDTILLTIIILFTALSGSKGSLVQVLMIFTVILNHSIFRSNKKIESRTKYIYPLGIISVLIVAFIVLTKESVDSEEAIFKFILRLLYGADSTLYFYLPVNQQYFEKFRFWEYPAYLLNGNFALLKLTDYMDPHGYTMIANLNPNSTQAILGANTPYYIEGQIYFGFYGAFIYSMLIGAFVAFVRVYFFNARIYSAFWFVLIACAVSQTSNATIEASYGITPTIETFLIIIPIFVLINFITYGKILFKKLHF